MVEWDTVVLNTVLSIVVAVVVGLYIRFKVKPKHEDVFEHNRNVEFKRIFNTIHFFDFHFENFVNYLEREMGPLSRDRETLTPQPKFKKMEDGSHIAEFS